MYSIFYSFYRGERVHTVYPATVLTRQKGNHPRDILRHRTPPQRAVVRHETLNLLGGPVGRTARNVMPRILGEHVALDTARRHAIDRDAALAKVGGKALDHADDGHLGRIVQDVVLYAEQARGDGAHENEAAVVLDVLVRGLPDEELGARVEVEDVVVLLLGDLLRLVPRLGPRVAHDDVDLAKCLLGLGEEPVDLGYFGHVGLDGDGLGAVVEALDDLAYFLGRALGRDVVHHDGSTALAQLDGAAAADASACTGDEGDLALEGGGGDVDDHFGREKGLVV